MELNRILSFAALTVALPLAAMAVPAAAAPASGSAGSSEPETERGFDVQAHRGGLGLYTESSLAAFANALDMGVSTLELDVQITADGVAVVTHDRKISDTKCVDTAPVTENDPHFPYVGKFVNTLTLQQIKTIDCGTLVLPEHPEQQNVPGAPTATLTEVLDLVKSYAASGVMLNIETKVEAAAPQETAPREQFVSIVLNTLRSANMLDRITIQSFDWASLMLTKQLAPDVPLVALTNTDFLQTGMDGASPWLGGIDIDDFGGDPVAAVASFGASALSPVQGTPQGGKVSDPGFTLYPNAAMIASAHARGIKVIPWTVDDPATMHALIDLGVDGIITNYPDRLRAVLSERGMTLPAPAVKK